MSLPVSDIVNVSILVAPTAPTARGFGVGLVVGLGTSLPLEERIRSYSDLAGVAVDFGTTTEEYKAAQAWFGQSPAPTRMKIGRRFSSGAAGHLRGGTASALLATYTGITNGGFDIVIDGVNRQIFALDFSAQVTMAGVAGVIQTKLAAALASTTCTWNATTNQFLITSPTVGTSSAVGYPTAPTGGSSPVDVKTTLALTNAAGALSVTGIAAETMTASLLALQAFDADFYHVTLTADASTQDQKDAMAWAESAASKVLFWFATGDANAPVSAATTDLGYYAKNLGYVRTVSDSDLAYPLVNTTLYESWAGAAIMATIDFTQPNAMKTLKFKQPAGFAAAALTTTQNANLDAKNYNRVVDRGGFKMFEEGKTAAGRFIDEVIGLDWLQSALQTAIFGTLTSAPGRIPLTDAGAAMLVQAATGVFDQAVRNGLIAPGVWRGQNVGERKNGEFLETGYYVFAGSVADMLQADKDLRKSPPITGICIGAGAIHSVQPVITFQR